MQRRLPKIGFVSAMAVDTAEVRLHELAIPADDVIDLDSLKRAGIVHQEAKRAKVIASGNHREGGAHPGPGGDAGRPQGHRGRRRLDR